jgi:diaminopimelate decarboxylase
MPASLELFPDSTRVLRGELTVGGVRASDLAHRFGTPLVVYCEETLRSQARALRETLGPRGRMFYGTKAFPSVAVLRLLREEGVGADVAAPGELAFARAAGLTGDDLVVHGNNKDEAFLREAAALDAPVVLDAPDEAALAAAAGVGRVLVRVTLGVDADTHEAIVTGHHGSKFGLPPAEASTSTSARSCPTSPPRRRPSAGSRRSPPAAGTSSAGRRGSPTWVGASASDTSRRTTCPRRPNSQRRRPRPHA